jgi:hypothetical protein
MSNTNIIFATARDSNQGAKSADGTTWKSSNLGTTFSYKSFGGEPGKFVYVTSDNLRRYTFANFGIIDNTIWHNGVLPDQQAGCIVAIAEGANTLFYSYDGAQFKIGPATV